ncbi:MAG: putative colanic acid biosynthesis acetyltransferase [Geobacteraceae bacterium]|nr:putative colanic acid biosynthesis acetyltransferase [Geobacteraceae bacterium]
MESGKLDISGNRQAAKYSNREQILRVLWGFAKPLFHFSPRIFFTWRSFLLRLFGARVGRSVHIYNSATVYMPWNLEIGDWSSVGEHAYIYNLGKISIGSRTTISQRAHLCAGTHDYTSPELPLLKPHIVIGNQAWICADAFVGPGVTIGEGAIIAARAVAVKNVPPWAIVAGNPAQFIKMRVLKTGQA